jgi:benzoate membrane transport protein
LAGIALLPIIINSLTDSLADSDFRDAAAVTFLVTISGISGWGVGAPFWGILAGLLIHQITHAGKIFKK